MEVGQRIEEIVDFFEGLIDFGLEFILLVFSQPQMILKLSLIKLTKPEFALLSTDFFERTVLLSQNVGVLVSHSIVVEFIQNTLLDHLLKIRVELRGDLLVQSNATTELQIILEQTVDRSLGGLHLSLQHPFLLLNNPILQTLDLLLQAVLLLALRILLFLVLHLNLSKVVKLVIERVFAFVFSLIVLLLLLLPAFPRKHSLLLFKLAVLFGVALVFVRLHLLLIDLLTVETHIVFVLTHRLIGKVVLVLFLLDFFEIVLLLRLVDLLLSILVVFLDLSCVILFTELLILVLLLLCLVCLLGKVSDELLFLLLALLQTCAD